MFNKALAWQKAQNAADPAIRVSYTTWANRLTQWKRDLPWLVDAPSQSLQQALKDLERAYQNFFAKRAQFPRFKKRGQRGAFRYPQGVKLEAHNGRLFLPKLGWMRLRLSREVLGIIKNATVSSSAGKWYVSLQTEREVQPPKHSATTSIGIDLGLVRFATLSDGRYYAPLNSLKRHELKLRRYQRALSRKVKFGQNWRKAKAKVTRIYARISHARTDYLHKTSTTISQNHAMVCIEELQVKNLSRAAAGSAKAPGRHVKAKSGLNKAILDQGWFEFRRQLQYKLDWNGGILVAVPAHYTSQTCPCCAHAAAHNRLSQSRFECMECGYTQHADVVGAINVLARGHRVAACGEEGAGLARKRKTKPASQKQEPTEADHALAA